MKASHQKALKTSLAAAFAIPLFFGAGCASIMNGGSRNVSIKSVPTGASVKISKADGEQVHAGSTPLTVSLDPSRGFFKGQAYVVRFEMPGYRAAEIAVRPEVSGWYVANLLFGGILGILIIDPATGAMWNLSPDKIDQSLSSDKAALLRDKKGFVVTLLAETTEAERSAMQRIN